MYVRTEIFVGVSGIYDFQGFFFLGRIGYKYHVFVVEISV